MVNYATFLDKLRHRILPKDKNGLIILPNYIKIVKNKDNLINDVFDNLLNQKN